jgi:hypothetical protein
VTSPSGRRVEHPSLPADGIADLVAELAGKSDLVWVGTDAGPARPLWSVWQDGGVVVVTGGIEQPDPGLADGGVVTVILRSKENRARQVSVRARVEQLVPRSEAWEHAVAALHPQRLNAPDGEAQPQRWERDSTVWRLVPDGDVVEQPGSYSSDAMRSEPLPTEATTLRRRPFHAGRATKKRR